MSAVPQSIAEPESFATQGAHQSFLLNERDAYWMVEEGYVDIFAVESSDGWEAVRRRPFVTRVEAGDAFFGAPTVPSAGGTGSDRRIFSFLAVPFQDTVLRRGERLDLASREDFSLDGVIKIDRWVAALAEFVARYEPPPPRDLQLLEADPDVPYNAGSTVTAHHLEVLWVWADRAVDFMGRAALSVEAGTAFPLTERTRFFLPGGAKVSALHTPGALMTGRLWPALDMYATYVFHCAETYWLDSVAAKQARIEANRRTGVEARASMFRSLAAVLVRPPDLASEAQPHGTPLQAAAAIVAEASGAALDIPRNAADEGAAEDAVAALVQPAGIQLRRIVLLPDWHKRDGPSFLGQTSGEAQRPMAVINQGGRGYRAIDPESGADVRVGRREAEALGAWGMRFYAPLAASVSSGMAAMRQALRGRGRDIAMVLAMGACGALVSLLVPVVTGQLLAEIIPRVDVAMWIAALMALGLGALAAAVFTVVGAFSLLRVEGRIDETLQSAVWNRLVSLPVPFFRDYVAGDLADRANGVTLIRQMLTGATAASMISGVFSVFSYGLLFWYSWQLALWAGAMIVVLGVVTWFFATRQVRHHRAAFTAQGTIDGLVFQMIMGLSKLRQANAEAHALNRWAEQYRKQKSETLKARYWSAGQLAFNSLFTPLSMLAVLALIFFALFAADDPVDFGLADFLSFNSAFGQFVAGVTGLTASWSAVIAILPLFERVQPILAAQPETQTGVSLPAIDGRLEFQNVSFRYPSAASDTLRNVTFDIRSGEYVAFVGASGSGKSTLYRLLIGFERPDSGSVLIDGHDLLSLNLSSVRSKLGVVLQNGELIPASIFRNIASQAALTMDEAWEAARGAGLDKDIEAMPMGMHTVLPEGGVGLSGGQKQRLLIARALARKPRVLLLDEATSMLDNRSQAVVQETLRGLSATRVLIAHRLSTVLHVDRIYVLQDGRIVESGPFAELMERDGALAELARRQMI